MLRSPPRQGGAVPGGWNGADCEEKVGRLSATRKEFRSIWGYRTVAGLVIRSQSRGPWSELLDLGKKGVYSSYTHASV